MYIFRPPTTDATSSSNYSPLSLRVFSSLPSSLSVRLSFCNLLCVRYTHTWVVVVVDTAWSDGGCCVRVSWRDEEVWDYQFVRVCVCVCERRYRQVVFIIIFFFSRRVRRETPTVRVHNNIQQQYKTFVNNTSSTLALSRRRSNIICGE